MKVVFENSKAKIEVCETAGVLILDKVKNQAYSSKDKLIYKMAEYVEFVQEYIKNKEILERESILADLINYHRHTIYQLKLELHHITSILVSLTGELKGKQKSYQYISYNEWDQEEE